MKASALIVVSTVVPATGSVLTVITKPARRTIRLWWCSPASDAKIERARHHRTRALLERRPDSDSERVGGGS